MDVQLEAGTPQVTVDATRQENPIDSPRRKMMMTTLKIAVVGLVLIGLIAASAVTFGMASGIVGAVFAVASSEVGMLYGASIGFALAAVTAPFVAHRCNMFEYTKHNLKDIGKFFLFQSLGTAAMAGAASFVGSYYGLELTQFFNPKLQCYSMDYEGVRYLVMPQNCPFWGYCPP